MSKTTTDLSTLKINVLTQAQYDDALANQEINAKELYLTPNTIGSTNSSDKLYLIGATSQAANPQTYSNENLYFNNGLYSLATDDSTYNTSIKQATVSNTAYINLKAANYDNTVKSWLEIRSDGYVDLSSIDFRLYLDDTLDATLISDISSLGWTNYVIV